MPAFKTFSICSQQHVVLLPPNKVPWTQDITVLHRAAGVHTLLSTFSNKRASFPLSFLKKGTDSFLSDIS